MKIFVATILFRSESETDAKSVIGATLEEVKNKVLVLKEKFKNDCFDIDDENYEESIGENYVNAWSNACFCEFSAEISEQFVGEDGCAEYCNVCEGESEINGIFEVQTCSKCGELIVPCSLCPIDEDLIRPCDTCPLSMECTLKRLNEGIE